MRFHLRNLVRVGLLVTFLFAGASFAQEPSTPKGFDIGSCSPSAFVAAHFVVVGKDLQVDKTSPGPNQVEDVTNGPVYKFDSEDKDGRHYVYVTKKGDKYDLVIGAKLSEFRVNGEMQSVLLSIRDDDGSALAENAITEYKVCIDLVSRAQEQHTDVDLS